MDESERWGCEVGWLERFPALASDTITEQTQTQD